MDVVGRSWILYNDALPRHSGLYISHPRSMYYNYDFGCINSSTGYHYVPSRHNQVYIVVASDSLEPLYPGSGPGVFYCDWWGRVTNTHPTVGCLNSPNYYLQQELSLWC